MRVLVWMETHYPVIGGIQTAARQYLPALAARGNEVKLVASHYVVELPDFLMQDTIPVHRFRFHDAIASNNGPLLLHERQRVTQFIRDFAPEVVHVMGFGLSGIFYSMSRNSYQCPYIFTIRTEDSSLLQTGQNQTLLRQLLSGASWVTTASNFEAARIAKAVPEVAARISSVYHGLPQPQEPLVAPPSTPQLLCIGRFEEQKNFDLAVHAFARIVESFPTARLIFAGDGSQREMVEQLVATLGLSERVDFLGWVQPEEIPALINQANAVVLPSRWEGLPLTAIQAAQMARPIVATRVSGTPEVVIDGETGWLSPAGDVEALALSMRKVLGDPARAAHMGQTAHARIYDKFSLAAMLDAYSSLYARVTAAAALPSGV